MLTTSSMELLSVVVFKEQAEAAAARLVYSGLFHPVDLRSLENGMNDHPLVSFDNEYSQWEDLGFKLTAFSNILGIGRQFNKDAGQFSCQKIKDLLTKLNSRVNPVVRQRQDVENELKTNMDILARMMDGIPASLRKNSQYTFLEISIGRLDNKNLPILESGLSQIPHVIYPVRREANEVVVLTIALRRDSDLARKALSDSGWKSMEDVQDGRFSKDLEAQVQRNIRQAKVKIDVAQIQIDQLAREFKDEIGQALSFVRIKKFFLEAQRYSYLTEKTITISGWIPVKEKSKITAALSEINDVFYIQEKRAEETGAPAEEVPVQLKHGRFLKPFDLLIEAYGVLRYGNIDPTAFVAIGFLLMFGFMFGDLGHGLVLFLAGIFLRRIAQEKIKQAGTLIAYCGASSMAFGLLWGSFFGLEFHSLLTRPMAGIMSAFSVCVGFGIVMVSLGVLFNMINSLRDKDYLKFVFDKAGLIAGLFYWAVLACVAKIIVFRSNIPAGYVWFAGIMLGVLFLKPFIEGIFKKHQGNILINFIEVFVEVIVAYSVNTVSFIRVAAFSLAHAGLFIAVFLLSGMVGKSGGGTFSWLIIISGNVLIIGLEGLIVTIQSLRLTYYEFFSKFFQTGKRFYKPLTI